MQWAKFRSGIVPVHTDVLYDAMYSEFNAWAKEEEIKCNRYSILTIKYFLPDYHGSQRVALILKTSGRSGWKRVFSGVPKPDFQDPEQVPYFVHTHIILSAGTPERLRIETSGYGGIGIVFVEFTTRKKRFVPVSVDKCEGKIENPETVLLDNSEWCYLGEKKISRYFRAMPAASKKSSFELTFRSDSL